MLSLLQRSWLYRIAECRDYVLLLGMPGTGKTATIVAAVAALVQRGASVLLTSYTNSAVDNILLRLQAAGINFLRLGRPDSVHPALRNHVLGADAFHDTSVAGLRHVQRTMRVVRIQSISLLQCHTTAVLTKKVFGMQRQTCSSRI